MNDDKIIESIRTSLGLSPEGEDFKMEIRMHVASALSILNQNGVGVPVAQLLNIDIATWGDFMDETKFNLDGMQYVIPMFVFLKTKILFDPPPPSNVEFYKQYIDETLWRIRIARE